MRKELKILSVLALSLTGQLAFAQIKGKVQESDGLPSIGSKVEIKGTGTFTRTNDDGEFELSTAKVGDVLVITNLDDQKQEVKATDDLVFKFSAPLVSKKETEIDAVTIIGSIQMNPNEQIGSIASVKSDDLASTPMATVNEALNGKVAGLNFAGNGGQPGAESSTIIRGINSFSGSSNPLYVIDGVPVGRGVDASDLLGGYTSFNPLSSIDPNSIESVTVLKDVSGTSLYGAQGANGVILIKTKSGKFNQKTKFSFTTEIGYQDEAFNKHHWMSSEEYIKWGGLAIAGKDYRNGALDAYSDANLAKYEAQYRDIVTDPSGIGWDGITNTKWDKEIQRNSSTVTQYSFNAVGGGANTSFNIGASYYKNDPLVKFTNFDRTSVNIGLNHKATEKLSFNFNGSVSNVKTKTYSGGTSYSNPWRAGFANLPFYSVTNPDGSYNTEQLNGFNAVELLQSDFLKGDMTTFLGAVGMDYNFIKDFKFTSNFSTQYQMLNEKSWWNQYTGNGKSRNGVLQTSNVRIFDYVWNNFVQYQKRFAEKHNLTIDVGMDYQEHSRRNEYEAGSGFPNYSQPELSWASNPLAIDGSKETWTQISYIGRLAYSFDRKYTVTANFRRDGNSTFGEDKKWGNFWNAGLMWTLSNESFLVDSKVINDLKLRANYGISGNAVTAAWGLTQRYRPTLLGATYNDDNAPALYINSAGNKDLKWEQAKQLNVGVDFGFLNKRLKGTIDYYNKKTEDLIALQTIPYTTGGPNSYYANVGSIRNRGLEITLTGVPIKTEDFYWSVTALASTNKSKVLKIAEGANLDAYGKRLDVGKQAGEYYLYGWAGVNPETGAGRWYTDETKSAITENRNEAKRYYQGHTNVPIWQATLTNEFSYKGFSLSFMFSGSFDYKVYDVLTDLWMSDGYSLGSVNQDRDLLYNSWTPNNPNADNPIQIEGNDTNSRLMSTRFLRKGDHIRLKDVKFSYTFGKETLGDIGIDAVTIYVRGTNLITWAFDSKLKSDPETVAASSTVRAGYPDFYRRGMYDFSSPLLRTYSFGITVNF
ncbi:SusC/RagA family TonB-linked outer membrane protein [Apibacter adventoris]|uniref:SusC/RagA family TonB-linked outer membrane protein n=1 Tax=Apibacter adventoris TaxID=1679466 RepID=UPI000CF6FBC3|nr:SusC/RagA family TonB-linked outer membrane protein [Apibacter adventoris]PQL95862.1 SusC/RagA family TonB-linked outer membrane protein [Apibacter adventoris]